MALLFFLPPTLSAGGVLFWWSWLFGPATAQGSSDPWVEIPFAPPGAEGESAF